MKKNKWVLLLIAFVAFLVLVYFIGACLNATAEALTIISLCIGMGSAWAFNFVLDSSCCSSYSMKESKVITQSSVRSQYFLFQQYSSSFSICMVHIYLPRSIHLKGKI